MAEIDEQLYKELIDKIKTYHPSDDFSMVEKAYKLAVEAHKEQKRKSGEPYIIHPLEGGIYSGGAGAGYGDRSRQGFCTILLRIHLIPMRILPHLFGEEVAVHWWTV